VRLLNNPATNGHPLVQFGLVKADRVNIRVYDLAGRVVREFPEKGFAPGQHTLVWDGTDGGGRALGSGVYFVHVRFQEQASLNAKKLVIIR
jgi:flagellar hook assembly protein FlgD